MTNTSQISLRVVPRTSFPFRWNASPPVGSCIAAARRGEYFAYLDHKLLEFLSREVHRAPLGDSVPDPLGEIGVRLHGTTRLLTNGTRISDIWAAKTGQTTRDYQQTSALCAETWGDRIEEMMFAWVTGWISTCIGPCKHSDHAEVRENVFEALEFAGASEWDWARSRKSITYGALRDIVRNRGH